MCIEHVHGPTQEAHFFFGRRGCSLSAFKTSFHANYCPLAQPANNKQFDPESTFQALTCVAETLWGQNQM